VAAWQAGELQQARQLLAGAAMADPDNLAIPRDLAKILWASGDGEQALRLLDSLPAEARTNQEIAHLHAHLSLAEAARTAPARTDLQQHLARQPDDIEARYQLAAVLLAADDLDAAMNELLAIVRQDRGFRQDIGRRSLLALFDLLGSAHPLSVKYRQALAESLN
jgi:putative thioredoxin